MELATNGSPKAILESQHANEDHHGLRITGRVSFGFGSGMRFQLIPVAVINLAQSADRRAHIAAHLGALGVPFKFFAAINGAQVSQPVRARHDPTIPVGFVGCSESHLALLREITQGDSEFVCVLEDDAELAPLALQLLELAVLRSLPRFDVLRLESYPRPSKRLTIPIRRFRGFDLVSTYKLQPALTAQIFSREGARKIVGAISYLRVSLDVALMHDAYVFGLRIIEPRPSLALPCETLPSTIGPGREPPRTAWEAFLYKRLRARELRNIISFLVAWGLPGLLHSRLS
jgi:hypothetical protein